MQSYRFPLFLALVGLALSVVGVGCGKEPFRYGKVSGKVTYDDGSPIAFGPVDPIVLTFVFQGKPADIKVCPRPGTAMIDKSAGTFDSVTGHMPGDGLALGRYKVILTHGFARTPLPASIVPAEYADPNRTPLEIEVAATNEPFSLKVRKPR